jgi:hypothetical protein
MLHHKNNVEENSENAKSELDRVAGDTGPVMLQIAIYS